MLDIRTDVPLAALTTLGVGGSAARFVEAHTDADLVMAAREPGAVLLGGGSNVVIADAGVSSGLVVAIRTRGVSTRRAGDVVLVTAAAGEPWDALVADSVAQGLAGLECLSGIPGLVGATPIQNVGAYGQEISDTVVSVRAYDLTEGREVCLTAAECQFGYRDSAFKSVFPGRFVVLEVTFALRNGAPRVPAYKELALALASESPSVERVREVVLALRRAKGMVVDPSDADSKSAGSFFTNPLLDDAAVERLRARLGATTLPTFPGGAGRTKVPAAFLIERAGFSKGTERGTARISRKHALALVNVGGSAAAVLALAREIRDAVQERFEVRLEPEPVLVGFSKTGALEW